MIQSIVADINTQTGESECRYYKERLLYLESGQKDILIDSSRILSCHGELKNNRGAVKTLSFFGFLVICHSGVGGKNSYYPQKPWSYIPKELVVRFFQDSGIKSEKYYKTSVWFDLFRCK